MRCSYDIVSHRCELTMGSMDIYSLEISNAVKDRRLNCLCCHGERVLGLNKQRKREANLVYKSKHGIRTYISSGGQTMNRRWARYVFSTPHSGAFQAWGSFLVSALAPPSDIPTGPKMVI